MDRGKIFASLSSAAKRYLPEGRELRTVRDAELRAHDGDDDDGPSLAGHAAIFGEWANIGGWFLERIDPKAFNKTIKEADVRMLFNHNPDTVLARTKNETLALGTDDVGLTYRGELNTDDPQAMSVHAKVKRGDVDQSSFAFRVIKEEWVEADTDGDTKTLPKRTILEAQLFDVSPVTYPAYEGTDVGVRAAADLALNQVSVLLGLSEEARDNILAISERGDKDEFIDLLEGALHALREDEEEEEITPAVEKTPDEEAGADAPAEEAPAAEEAPDKKEIADDEQNTAELETYTRFKERILDARKKLAAPNKE